MSLGIHNEGSSQRARQNALAATLSVVSERYGAPPFLVLVATISVDLQLHGESLQIDTNGNSQHKIGCTVSFGIDTDGRSQNSYSSGIDTDGRSQHSYSEE